MPASTPELGAVPLDDGSHAADFKLPGPPSAHVDVMLDREPFARSGLQTNDHQKNKQIKSGGNGARIHPARANRYPKETSTRNKGPLDGRLGVSRSVQAAWRRKPADRRRRSTRAPSIGPTKSVEGWSGPHLTCRLRCTFGAFSLPGATFRALRSRACPRPSGARVRLVELMPLAAFPRLQLVATTSSRYFASHRHRTARPNYLRRLVDKRTRWARSDSLRRLQPLFPQASRLLAYPTYLTDRYLPPAAWASRSTWRAGSRGRAHSWWPTRSRGCALNHSTALRLERHRRPDFRRVADALVHRALEAAGRPLRRVPFLAFEKRASMT